MKFISKGGTDEYVNMFASSFDQHGSINLDNFDYNNSSDPIVLRGILRHDIMKKCWEDKRDFYYIDSGYMGNYKSPINPMGYKIFHRIVKNDLQHNVIVERPSDRWEALKYKIPKWKKDGRNILVVMPSEKPAIFYDINLQEWKNTVLTNLKKFTDRPIIVREKEKRKVRLSKSIYEELDNAFAVVTLQSVAATEAILYGVPAFTLAPNAASLLSSSSLEGIEHPLYPDSDFVYKWACHLAYGQFHNSELKDGTARKILEL